MQTILERPRATRAARSTSRTGIAVSVNTKTKPAATPRKPDEKTLRLIEAIKGLKGLR